MLKWLLLSLALSGCSGWSVKDRLMFGGFTACQAYNYKQTDVAIDSGNYRELNPILGATPSEDSLLLVKTAVVGSVFLLANWLEEYRTPILGVGLGVCAADVIHNYSIGMRFP